MRELCRTNQTFVVIDSCVVLYVVPSVVPCVVSCCFVFFPGGLGFAGEGPGRRGSAGDGRGVLPGPPVCPPAHSRGRIWNRQIGHPAVPLAAHPRESPLQIPSSTPSCLSLSLSLSRFSFPCVSSSCLILCKSFVSSFSLFLFPLVGLVALILIVEMIDCDCRMCCCFP